MKEGKRVGVYHKDEIWKEDIMSYFGEFIEEKEAEELARRFRGDDLFDAMNRIRNMLKERGFDVPFRAVYRRTKDE